MCTILDTTVEEAFVPEMVTVASLCKVPVFAVAITFTMPLFKPLIGVTVSHV